MRTDDPNYPFKRNPLKFSDVARAAAMHWCVSEASALKYLETQFDDPGEALDHVRQYRDRSPDALWDSL